MTIEEISHFSAELAPFSTLGANFNNTPTIEFRKPSELLAYSPPIGSRLLGDNHLNKGAIGVIAGAPGVGKSRAAMALAIAGATKGNWFGFQIHRTFRTLIIQNENGQLRLKQELQDIGVENLDDFLRISPPPPFGLDFYDPNFVDAIKTILAEFSPDLVIIDPWTAMISDDKGKDYRQMLQLLRGIFGSGDLSPALLIVAHTRKPGLGEKARGRRLLRAPCGGSIRV